MSEVHEIKERPILFKGPLVRAILEGRKTVTRRVVKPQHWKPRRPVTGPFWGSPGYPRAANGEWGIYLNRPGGGPYLHLGHCPYGQPGDRLWVRETFWAKHDVDGEDGTVIDCGPCLDVGEKYHPGIDYCATPEALNPPKGATPHAKEEPGAWWEAPPEKWDGNSDYKGRGQWTFLPWNLYSKCPSIHMPRWASRIDLEVTAVRVERINEITAQEVLKEGYEWQHNQHGERCQSRTVGQFAESWDQINGPRGFGWDANPWVFVIDFKRIKAPE